MVPGANTIKPGQHGAGTVNVDRIVSQEPSQRERFL